MKVRLVGDRPKVGLTAAAVTFNVTGIDCGELDAPVLATEMEPVYVPAARLAGLTPMLRFPGVVPLAVVVSKFATVACPTFPLPVFLKIHPPAETRSENPRLPR